MSDKKQELEFADYLSLKEELAKSFAIMLWGLDVYVKKHLKFTPDIYNHLVDLTNTLGLLNEELKYELSKQSNE